MSSETPQISNERATGKDRLKDIFSVIAAGTLSFADYKYLERTVRDVVFRRLFKKDPLIIEDLTSYSISDIWKSARNSGKIPDYPKSYIESVVKHQIQAYNTSLNHAYYNRLDRVVISSLEQLETEQVLVSSQKKRYAKTPDRLNGEEFDNKKFESVWDRSAETQVFPSDSDYWTPAMKTQLRSNLTLSFTDMEGWSSKNSVTEVVALRAGAPEQKGKLGTESGTDDDRDENRGKIKSKKRSRKQVNLETNLYYDSFLQTVRLDLLAEIKKGKPSPAIISTAWYLVFNTEFTFQSIASSLRLSATSSAEYLTKQQLRIFRPSDEILSFPEIWRRRLIEQVLPDDPPDDSDEGSDHEDDDWIRKFIKDLSQVTETYYEQYGKQEFPGL